MLKKTFAALTLGVVISILPVASGEAATPRCPSPYYYTTIKHGHKVYVDVSGGAWKSRHDAIKESKRLLKWLRSYL